MTTSIEQIQKNHDDLKAHMEKHMAIQQAELDKLTKPAGPFVPGVGERYHYVTSAGNVILKLQWDGGAADLARLAMGDVYRTEQDAADHVRRTKILVKYRGMTKGSVPDWSDDDQEKWFSYKAHGEKGCERGMTYTVQYLGVTYFATQADAQAAFDAVGEADMMLLMG